MKSPKQAIEAVAASEATPGVELIPGSSPAMPLPYEAEMVSCGVCKHWRQIHPKSAAGQCLINAKFMSGPFYTTNATSCALGECA